MRAGEPRQARKGATVSLASHAGWGNPGYNKMEIFYNTLLLTFKLATLTTLILFIIGLPLAYALSYHSFKGKIILETLLNTPLILPPTVFGFYFLLLFGQEGLIGKLIKKLISVDILFTFEGILIASVIYNIPFMIQPLQTGFKSINKSIIEVSYTLGKSKLTTLFKIILPNMKTAIFTALVLTFAHTIGEFGVVLMVGGSIPNETLVASIAIYQEVENLNYDVANKYALVLFLISFSMLLALNLVNKHIDKD